MKQFFIFLSSFLLSTYSGFSQDTTSLTKVDSGYWTVDQSATFKGGDINTFSNWLCTKILYPAEAVEGNISGKVLVQFSVNSLGNVCDIKIVQSIHPAIDQAVIDAVYKSPKWKPAITDGVLVKQNFVIPVNFTLNIK